MLQPKLNIMKNPLFSSVHPSPKQATNNSILTTYFILFIGHYLGPFRPVIKIQNLALTEVASTWQELGSIIIMLANYLKIFTTYRNLQTHFEYKNVSSE